MRQTYMWSITGSTSVIGTAPATGHNIELALSDNGFCWKVHSYSDDIVTKQDVAVLRDHARGTGLVQDAHPELAALPWRAEQGTRMQRGHRALDIQRKQQLRATSFGTPTRTLKRMTEEAVESE